MTFYERNGMLYARVNGKRVSTKLKYSKENMKLFESYAKNNKFFNKFNVKTNFKTLVQLCEDFVRESEKNLKQTTITTYKRFLSCRITPYFDKKIPQEIRPIDIKDFYETFDDKSSLNICKAILKPAFEKAIIFEYIVTTPMVISMPKMKSTSYAINPFNMDEIKIILDKADGQFKNFVGISFFTGMRTGECLGLKWSDIDFQELTIDIQRTVTNNLEQTPKTKSSERTIDIISQCEYFLKEQRKLTGLSEFVFISRINKKRYNGSSDLRYMWRKLLKDTDLEYRSIYQTRHTFASNMLSNGESDMWVSATLGHKSTTTTRDKYSKYIRIERKKKTTYLDDVFKLNNTKTAQ